MFVNTSGSDLAPGSEPLLPVSKVHCGREVPASSNTQPDHRINGMINGREAQHAQITNLCAYISAFDQHTNNGSRAAN